MPNGRRLNHAVLLPSTPTVAISTGATYYVVATKRVVVRCDCVLAPNMTARMRSKILRHSSYRSRVREGCLR